MDTMLTFATSAPAMADINVFSEDGQLVVAIKILGTYSTPEYLERMRALLLERTARARPQYLMLVQPRGLHLWHGDAQPNTEPQFAPLDPIVRVTAPSLAEKSGNLHPRTLPILLSTWLNILAFGLEKPDINSRPDQLLVESGGYARILDGSAKIDVES